MLTKKEKIFHFIDKYVLLLPIIFAMAVIPLIARVISYDPQLSQYPWFYNEEKRMDAFLYYKNQAMIWLDGILVLSYIYLLIRKKLVKSFYFIPLFVYLFLCVLSAVFSIAPVQTWNGFDGMMESAYALFGYSLICYFAFTVVQTEKQLKWIMGFFAVGTLIMGLIGVSQFVGVDFYTTELGKNLIFPTEYAAYKDTFTAQFWKGAVYTSLFNPNYVGVYSCLLVPLLFVLLFSAKRKTEIFLYVLLISLVLVCLVGSGSQGGILALAVGLLFAVFYFTRKHWKSILPIVVVSMGIFIALNLYQGEKNAVTDTVDKITADISTNTTIIEGNLLSDIILNDTDFQIIYNEERLIVQYDFDTENQLSLRICDTDGNVLELKENEAGNGYLLTDKKYKGLEFIPATDKNSHTGFSIKADGCAFFIYYSQTEQTYLYTNAFGRSTKLHSSETFYSPVFDLLGGYSGRDFIWAKSVPILKKTLFLGTGPDTFAFVFPQYDYVDLLQDGWRGQIIIKPHSIYLQMGIQTGVLSLIAFLIFHILYLIQSLKLYYKRKLRTFTERCGAGILIVVISYLMVGLANDSTVGVSVIYWTLLGLGFACNHMIDKQEHIQPTV